MFYSIAKPGSTGAGAKATIWFYMVLYALKLLHNELGNIEPFKRPLLQEGLPMVGDDAVELRLFGFSAFVREAGTTTHPCVMPVSQLNFHGHRMDIFSFGVSNCDFDKPASKVTIAPTLYEFIFCLM